MNVSRGYKLIRAASEFLTEPGSSQLLCVQFHSCTFCRSNRNSHVTITIVTLSFVGLMCGLACHCVSLAIDRSARVASCRPLSVTCVNINFCLINLALPLFCCSQLEVPPYMDVRSVPSLFQSTLSAACKVRGLHTENYLSTPRSLYFSYLYFC